MNSTILKKNMLKEQRIKESKNPNIKRRINLWHLTISNKETLIELTKIKDQVVTLNNHDYRWFIY